MTHKKYFPLLFYCLLLIGFCLLDGCYSNRQIVIDDALNTGSERWKATVRNGSTAIGRTNFGPFNTISCSKLDSPKLKSRSDGIFSIHIFRNEQTKRKRKVYSLTTTLNMDTATALIQVWITSASSEPGMITLFGDHDSHPVSKSKTASGEISINNDSFLWSFNINCYYLDPFKVSDSYNITSGFLVSDYDTINISNASEFTDGKQGYGVSKGINLNNKTGQIAALQLIGDKYVWIRRDLPVKTQLVIATFFCAVLGTKDL